MPDIIFQFYNIKDHARLTTDNTVNVSLTPDEYMKSYLKDEELNCKIGILDHNGPNGWSFGLMFLKPYIFTYDFKEDRIS